MSDKEGVLAELDSEFERFLASTESLSSEALTRGWLGRWSVREIIVHVTGWQREMIGVMERMGRGERPTPEGVDYSDSDGWNARFVAEAAAHSVEQVLQDLRTTFAAYRQAAMALPEDRFTPERTLDRLLHSSGINHFKEHGQQIRGWRQKEGL